MSEEPRIAWEEEAEKGAAREEREISGPTSSGGPIGFLVWYECE